PRRARRRARSACRGRSRADPRFQIAHLAEAQNERLRGELQNFGRCREFGFDGVVHGVVRGGVHGVVRGGVHGVVRGGGHVVVRGGGRGGVRGGVHGGVHGVVRGGGRGARILPRLPHHHASRFGGHHVDDLRKRSELCSAHRQAREIE